jgi:uncharacterized protein YceH (UPF0502 family)
MKTLLDEVEVRVLGALIEKEITTPEYYPLSLNALTTACNQKSNRHPVVAFDEKVVARALESLREQGLVRVVSGAEMRVPRYYHLFADKFRLAPPEVAALCVLMLRGPQTVGEIRGRAERLHAFADLEEVERTLEGLAARQEGSLVVQLERQPGRKEPRHAHLLSGEPPIAAEEGEGPVEPAVLEIRSENERLARLEEEVQALRQELETFREEFARFRSQFE